MNEPPDQTAELSAANLLSFSGMTVPKYSRDEVLVLAQARVHVEEQDALPLELLLELVVDDLGLVLGADAGEVLLLRLGDAEPVPRLLDVRRQVLPGVRLLLGRLDVVVDVLEVDAGEVGPPVRHRTGPEVLERLEAGLPHPVRLVLVGRDLGDPLRAQSTLGLEDVVLGIVEAVLLARSRCRYRQRPRSPGVLTLPHLLARCTRGSPCPSSSSRP